jgi:signal transduction histidine kinase
MEAVIETLASVHEHGDSRGELAHDARNMVTALSLYCDLLEEPGVLNAAHRHYASELRLVAEASRRLVEKLALLDSGGEAAPGTTRIPAFQARVCPEIAQTHPAAATRQAEFNAGALNAGPVFGGLIGDLREELLSSRGLLAAIAGPSVTVGIAADGGARPVRMSGENLIRTLVNLVKNSAESIIGGGRIDLRLAEQREPGGAVRALVLTLEDTGCGIPPEFLEKIFDPGFTTHAGGQQDGGWMSGHRGLGLAITRSIVTAAGGRIHAENRTPQGTRFVIELPARNS